MDHILDFLLFSDPKTPESPASARVQQIDTQVMNHLQFDNIVAFLSIELFFESLDFRSFLFQRIESYEKIAEQFDTAWSIF